jgi:hypothetical protein
MIWFAAAAAALAVGSTVYSAAQQGRAAREGAAAALQTGAYNKAVADYNAKVAANEAGLARALARNRVAGIKQQSSKAQGAGRAAMAAAGVDVNALDTSPMDALEQMASDYASQAEYEEWLGEYQATSKENEAKLLSAQGRYMLWKSSADGQMLLNQAPTVLGTMLKAGAAGMSAFSGAGGMAGGTSGVSAATQGQIENANAGAYTRFDGLH